MQKYISTCVCMFIFVSPITPLPPHIDGQAKNESFSADCGSLSASFKASNIVKVCAKLCLLSCVSCADIFRCSEDTRDEGRDRVFFRKMQVTTMVVLDFVVMTVSHMCRVLFRFGVGLKSSFVGWLTRQQFHEIFDSSLVQLVTPHISCSVHTFTCLAQIFVRSRVSVIMMLFFDPLSPSAAGGNSLQRLARQTLAETSDALQGQSITRRCPFSPKANWMRERKPEPTVMFLLQDPRV